MTGSTGSTFDKIACSKSKELFYDIMTFKKPKRTPLWLVEPVVEQAQRKWCRDENFPLEMTANDMFHFDGDLVTFNMTDQAPLPAFAPKIISEDDDYVILQDRFGFTVKNQKGWSVWPAHYSYIDAPLKSMSDWKEMKKRFDPSDIRRCPIWWNDEMFAYLNQSSGLVSIGVNWGPARGPKNGYMFGFERFMELISDEPEIFEDMFDFWSDFLIKFFSRFIDKLAIDVVYFIDDGIAYGHSTIISPATFEKIYKPYMRKVVDFLKSKGVAFIGHNANGNIEPLVPNLLDVGVNIIAPVEVAAGLNAVKLRKKYGKELLMIGNISREALMKGKKEIYEEVMSKVPYLMEDGGYIPAFDDMVMPDMTFENVKYCVDLIRSIGTENTGNNKGKLNNCTV